MSDDAYIKTYKGFDKNLQCRGYQYEVGKTYRHEGCIQVCKAGFHACEYPLDIFQYYPPASSRYAATKSFGYIASHDADSKVVSYKLSLESEVSLHDLAASAVQMVLDHVLSVGAATNTGVGSAAMNTGYQSAATNTGNYSAATNTGNRSAATNTGNRSAATNTGNQSAATNTGVGSAATNTGYRSAAEVSGGQAVAASVGIQGRARASAGSAIVLCYRDLEGAMIHIRASKVGENGIKPDTWYSLDESGEFVEVADEESQP